MAFEPTERLPEDIDPRLYATWDWRTGKLHVPARYDYPDTEVAEVIGEDWRQVALDELVRMGYVVYGDWHDNQAFENSTILLRK